MKGLNCFTLAYAASATLAFAATASAGVIAVESFDYSPGAIDGSGSFLDAGWGGNWFNGAGGVELGSLAGTVASLPSAGNRFVNTGEGRAVRAFDANYNDGVSQTLYMSFLYQDITTGSSDYDAFELYDGNVTAGDPNRVLQIGALSSDGLNTSDVQLRLQNDPAARAGLGSKATSSDFYLIEFDLVAGGNDTISVWRNPSLSLGSADAVLTVGNFAFDRIAIATFGTDRGARVDEFRFGTELSDVSAIPEPATALLILGGGGLLALRRLGLPRDETA